MKASVYLWGLMCALLMFGGCKTKQSAYKQAYDAAQMRPTVYQAPPAVYQSPTPAFQEPATPTPAPTRVFEQSSTEYFQEERITQVMDGRSLKQFSVVIGSFVNRTNAESLKNRMQTQGFSPVVVQNEKGLYRVIVATFDTRAEATAQRNAVKNRFPEFFDAWLLNRVY